MDFKESVVYQIYVRSFKDSNGDGFGDLRGVIEKLDYLALLGVDYIWLTPVYVSPQNDNGYDVADYYNIDKRFGTMDDFEKLVEQSKKRGIEIMLDMVFNHTSTEHEWFKKACDGNQTYKDFYIFRKGDKGAPTNWESKFGGSAWEYVESIDEYYLHLFDTTQGDLNWDNELVREEIYKVVRFWLSKGVKGFRLDVINLISKPTTFENDLSGDGRQFYTDGPNIHKYLKELNDNTFATGDAIVTVGEMSSTSIDNCIKYSNPEENELSMVFNFHHLKVDYKDGDKWTLMNFDFARLKQIFKEWQEGIQAGNGWSAVFWCNHDQPRIVSRMGNTQEYHKESAKMLATSIHLLRGTPYIYQGEEFGMINPNFDTIAQYRDVESINYFEILKQQGAHEADILNILKFKSRDNSRTPMQWDDSENAGFTIGKPWISVGQTYKKHNAKIALMDKDSVFYHYQSLIKLRKSYSIISRGQIKMILEQHPRVFAYLHEDKNQKVIVLNNFFKEETAVYLPEELVRVKQSKVIISNYKDSCELKDKITLRPYESVAYLIET